MRKAPYHKPKPKQTHPYGQKTVDCKNTINQVIIIGYLGADPELISFKSGTFIVNLSVATSTKYTDKQTGKKVDNTQWHKVAIYDMALGEWVFKTFQKGSLIYVEGKLRQRQYQDDKGITRYITQIEPIQIQEV